MSDNPDFLKIKESYVNRIELILPRSQELEGQLMNQQVADSLFSEMKMAVHKLAGSASIFGYEKLEVLAKETELTMNEITMNQTVQTKLLNLFSALNTEMQDIINNRD